jgi:hypothetical protein
VEIGIEAEIKRAFQTEGAQKMKYSVEASPSSDLGSLRLGQAISTPKSCQKEKIMAKSNHANAILRLRQGFESIWSYT